MRKKILWRLLVGSSFGDGMGISGLWMGEVGICGDGKEILLCYKGEIYKVCGKGGEGVELSREEWYE